MARTTLNLPEDLFDALAELAKANGVKASCLAMHVLRDYIEYERSLRPHRLGMRWRKQRKVDSRAMRKLRHCVHGAGTGMRVEQRFQPPTRAWALPVQTALSLERCSVPPLHRGADDGLGRCFTKTIIYEPSGETHVIAYHFCTNKVTKTVRPRTYSPHLITVS